MAEEDKIFYKHAGLYAFSQEALEKMFYSSSVSIENAEQLESLRFLYYNLKLRVHETEHEVFGIDLPEHLAKAESHLKTLLWSRHWGPLLDVPLFGGLKILAEIFILPILPLAILSILFFGHPNNILPKDGVKTCGDSQRTGWTGSQAAG